MSRNLESIIVYLPKDELMTMYSQCFGQEYIYNTSIRYSQLLNHTFSSKLNITRKILFEYSDDHSIEELVENKEKSMFMIKMCSTSLNIKSYKKFLIFKELSDKITKVYYNKQLCFKLFSLHKSKKDLSSIYFEDGFLKEFKDYFQNKKLSEKKYSNILINP